MDLNKEALPMKRSVFLLILIGSLFLTGCGAPAAPAVSTQSSETAVTFTDALGRSVTVDSPRRVACLIGSFADIWCLAGGKEQLVAAADDTWTQFDLGLSDEVVNLGGVKEPNLELLLAAQPDLVIASSNTGAQVELLDSFEEMGLNVAYFMVASFDEYLEMLKLCTRITGREKNYQRYGSELLAQVDAARAKADGSAPRVLYVRATGSSCKVKNSRDSVLGEMLADLGCVNIADSGLLEELSMEVILQEDPGHIFVVLQGSDPSKAEALLEKTLLSNPAWTMLTAVKEGRFHVMDPDLYNLKPNERWGEAYEKLSDILYE
ncbi:MAG: ABC transporter substrate-binding protein [Oscillibacter sp.]|nr:ABC transporter substrate-binding protein [Oscillibacter sp.]